MWNQSEQEQLRLQQAEEGAGGQGVVASEGLEEADDAKVDVKAELRNKSIFLWM